MNGEYKVGDIISGQVTGIEKYGIFVSVDHQYDDSVPSPGAWNTVCLRTKQGWIIAAHQQKCAGNDNSQYGYRCNNSVNCQGTTAGYCDDVLSQYSLAARGSDYDRYC